MDNRDEYDYGYGPKGERVYALNSGSKSERVNMIAAIRGKQLMAPFTIEGAWNRMLFETWLETCLIPMLKSAQKLGIDNASFHQEGQLSNWWKQQGVKFGICRPILLISIRLNGLGLGSKVEFDINLEYFGSLREAMEHVLCLVS